MKKYAQKTVLLVHEECGSIRDGGYLINLMRPIWEEWGCRVLEIDGLSKWPEADGVFLHVDLSLVSSAYTEPLASYPVQWNAGALDITKQSICQGLVRPGDGYDGPVIVKTNLNHAGVPERNRLIRKNNRLRRTWRSRFWPGWCDSHLEKEPPCLDKSDYRIYANPGLVPKDVFASTDWVVQQFCSEPLHGGFALREYYFLGDAEYVRTEISPDAIFTSASLFHEGSGPVPEELSALRRRMGLDYGKIDYVMKEGKPFIFDVNKTIGINPETPTGAWKIAQCLAWGLLPEWRIHREACRQAIAP